eukprot:TRINITY_DN8471_c0_g1_i1.p1 TRINITY_DN8471_c0_g1~~TRINITY_DN8471_c0_g1_i1.p1  ORF type:complete len:130 (-),score=4.10 TRINITY_DN8471_c0_g1_i1:47-436(-)
MERPIDLAKRKFTLPIWKKIFSFLDGKSQLHLALTCRDMKLISAFSMALSKNTPTELPVDIKIHSKFAGAPAEARRKRQRFENWRTRRKSRQDMSTTDWQPMYDKHQSGQWDFLLMLLLTITLVSILDV